MYYRRIFDLPTWGFRRTFDELDRLQNRMDELYGALSGGAFPKLSAGVFPLTNITEDGGNFYVRAELPGMKSNDLNIQVTSNGISISGERKIPEEGNNVRYHRREREAGKFSRLINLSGDIDTNKVDAVLKNGILTVKLPKVEPIKPRQITVK